MENKKIIIHINDTLCYGGKENVVINICNGLDKEKYKVNLIILSNDNLSQINKVSSDVNILILPFSERSITGIHSLNFFFKGIPYLKKIIEKINPSIIHTHSALHRLVFIFMAIRMSSVKCQQFHTIHTSGNFYNPTNLFERFKLFIEKNNLKSRKPIIIAVSKPAEEKCILHFKNCYKAIYCIPNGVRVTNFYKESNSNSKVLWGFNSTDIVIVYVARLCEGKSHLTLLKAIKLLSSQFDTIRLCLVGDGEYKTSLEEYVSKNSLQKHVIFKGASHKVKEILSISDIGVFPSEYEGMSIALLEMMAAGLPIVCSDIPIFKQLFAEPGSALFFKVTNSFSLSAKLAILCGSKELQIKMGERSKFIAKEYSIEKMIQKHEEYYG